MIRQNLATKPFYNDSAVRIAIAVAAVLVAVFTVFNIQRLVHYSTSDTEAATQASNDERRAAELRREAARLRASVDGVQVQMVATSAHEANDLIDRRTFSWTSLFNQFESTLPANVRITSLRKTADERGNIINVSVVARGVDDVRDFIEQLDANGAFRDVLPVDEQINPDTTELMAVLQMVYRPVVAPGDSPTAQPSAKPGPGAVAPVEPAPLEPAPGAKR